SNILQPDFTLFPYTTLFRSDLKVGFNYPFAFNTPFGADLGLKIFKRDTTFLEVNARAALEYLLRRSDKVRIFVNNKNSQRLGQQDRKSTRLNSSHVKISYAV